MYIPYGFANVIYGIEMQNKWVAHYGLQVCGNADTWRLKVYNLKSVTKYKHRHIEAMLHSPNKEPVFFWLTPYTGIHGAAGLIKKKNLIESQYKCKNS